MVNLRLLRSFIAVAETEHVGRAAVRLHISQSPLSRQIKELEAELGLSLFERERKRLRITESGRWLLREATELVAHAERIERDASRLAAGDAGTLTVGFVKTAMWTRVLPRALRRFRGMRPDVAIELRNMRSVAQVDAVRQGGMDVGLVQSASADADLVNVALLDDPLVLALPAAHHLATKTHVRPGDLNGESWVALTSRGGRREREELIARCARAGFVPSIRFEATDLETVLALVEAGMGVAVLPSSAGHGVADVVFRVLPWLREKRRLWAIHRGSSASPLATKFVECLVASAPERNA